VIPRRHLLVLLGAGALGVPRPAPAQPAKALPKIGFLDPFVAGQRSSESVRAAFAAGLRERGWVEGQNVVIEYRAAAGQLDQFSALAAEFARIEVRVIVSSGDQLIAAARKAAPATPIVMAGAGDPVGAGLVASLARPGGLVTGVSNLAVGLTGKWLELIREAMPRATRVAALRNLGNPTHMRFMEETEAAAAKLGITILIAGYRGPADIEGALAGAVTQRAQALVVLPDPIPIAHHPAVAQFVTRNRLPTVFLFRDLIQDGGLLSYGPSRTDNYRRAAGFVDRILRGANPANLPVEQPVKFELAVNLVTARALGITIPQAMLMRADQVIE